MMMPADGMTLTGRVTGYDYGGGGGVVITRKFCPISGAGIFSTHAEMENAVFLPQPWMTRSV